VLSFDSLGSVLWCGLPIEWEVSISLLLHLFRWKLFFKSHLLHLLTICLTTSSFCPPFLKRLA
jgi:hypothetical protein